MTKICNKYLDGVKPYNTRFLLAFAGAFLICGLAMLFTYDHPVIRCSIIAASVVAMIIKRNEIKESFQKIMALRK